MVTHQVVAETSTGVQGLPVTMHEQVTGGLSRPPERVPCGPAPREPAPKDDTVMTRQPRAGILPSVAAIVSHDGNGAESPSTVARRQGRRFFGSFATTSSYEASTASRSSSSGIAPSSRREFQPDRPM